MRSRNIVISLAALAVSCLGAEEHLRISIPFYQVGFSISDQNGNRIVGSDTDAAGAEIKAVLKRDMDSKTGIYSPRTICEFYDEIHASLPESVVDNLYQNWSRDGLLEDFSAEALEKDRVPDISIFFMEQWDMNNNEHPLSGLMSVGDDTGKFLTLINKSRDCETK